VPIVGRRSGRRQVANGLSLVWSRGRGPRCLAAGGAHQPDIHTQLDTVVPVSAQARSAVAATVDAMSSDNMSALAGLMDPAGHAGVSTSQLASTLAGQHVHVTSLRTTGPGRLVWLTDGQPGWEQPVQGSAATQAGVSLLTQTLLLVDEDNRWLLLGSFPTPQGGPSPTTMQAALARAYCILAFLGGGHDGRAAGTIS
jgi:hypothetical protein